jgi:zinc and cadmium transporter
MFIEIIIATLLVSLISFVGIILSYEKIKRFMHYFISFAAGIIIAFAFFDLIPESLDALGLQKVSVEFSMLFIVGGVLLFFLIESFMHWHHCGKDDDHDKPHGKLVLVGASVHNFIDGLLIAGAFIVGTPAGIITTLLVMIHEIPHEFGHFAVLIHSGMTKSKALWLNFLSALLAIAGGIMGFFIFDAVHTLAPYALLVTAGGFLYVALSDIVPSLHQHETNRKMIFLESLIFLATIVGAYFFLQLMHVA